MTTNVAAAHQTVRSKASEASRDTASDKLVDHVGGMILTRQGLAGIDAGTVRLAFLRIVAKTPNMQPSAADGKRAFTGYSNIGKRTGASQGPRDAAFVAQRVAHLASRHAAVRIEADAETAEWFREAPPAGGPAAGESAAVVADASGVRARIFAAVREDAPDGFADAFAALCRAPMAPSPATVELVEDLFEPFVRAEMAAGYLAPTFAGQGGKAASVNTVFDRWEPRIVSFDGMRAHPAPLIEAKTLASVAVRGAGETPNLPARAIQSGAYSDAQLESVTLAVSAHERKIDVEVDGSVMRARQAFLVGDGTGVGKTQICVGVLQHNWNQNRRRHLYLMEKEEHVRGLRKAVTMTGASLPIHLFNDVKSPGGITANNGVVAVTYAMLRQRAEDGHFPNVDLLVGWMLKGGLDGCLILDESQALRNTQDAAEASKNSYHAASGSDQAEAAVQLMESLLDARIVYASATGATQLPNLAYMSRLGIWGPGTPYKNFADFADKFERTHMSLETIPLHLKSAGLMTSRTLSLEGVSYGTIEHVLTVEETDHYQEVTRLIDRTVEMVAKSLNASRPAGYTGKTLDMSRLGMKEHAVWSTGTSLGALTTQLLSRILDSTDLAIMMPSVLRAGDAALERGEALVLQVAHTNEADIRRNYETGNSGSSNPMTDAIIMFLDTVVMPIAAGAAGKRPNPLFGSPAVYRNEIEKIRDEWKALPPLTAPLDAIMMHYGPEAVGEMTGRKIRRVPVDTANPALGFTIEQRGDKDAIADHAAFMGGRKDIIAFSTAFGGSGYDYHASRDCRNQKRRFHIIIETGNQADIAIQGIGRTHRNNQASAPSIMLATCDIPGVAIANTRVVKRIASLGAISMGHREASNRSLFSAIDDYDSVAATMALDATLKKLRGGAYPELPGKSLDEKQAMSRFSDGKVAIGKTLRFFKSLRMTPLDYQRMVVARYLQEYNALDEKVRNTGDSSAPYVVRNEMDVVAEETIFEDQVSRERVDAVTLKGNIVQEYLTFKDSLDEAKAYSLPHTEPLVRWLRASRRVVILAKVDVADKDDPKKPVWRMYSPDGVDILDDYQRYEIAAQPLGAGMDDAELWGHATDRLREMNQASKILVTGAILRIAPIVSRSQLRNRLVIVPTTDGRQLAGYMITREMLDTIRLEVPELARQIRDQEHALVVDALEKGSCLLLDNAMTASLQLLPQLMMPTPPDGGYDPDDRYLCIRTPAHGVAPSQARWLRRLGLTALAPATRGAMPDRHVLAWSARRETLRDVLSVANVSDWDHQTI